MSCLINPYIYEPAEEPVEAGAFVMKINTDGGTNYTMGISGTYDCVVDWSDGTSSVLNTSGAGRGFSHTYPSAGEYIISISGDFRGLYQFDIAQAYRNMIKDILQWGDSPWGNTYLAFFYCRGIGHISATDQPNFLTTSLQEFFNQCSLTSGVAHWDVSNITNMERMFDRAPNFNEDLTNWCVSNIASEPPNFSRSSPLSAANKPKWGTCP